MPFLLYAVGLVICGAAVHVQLYIARWGSEEPDWWGWHSVIVGAGIAVLVFNILGFAALAVLQWRRRTTRSWLHVFLLGGLSGVIGGVVTGWFMDQSFPVSLVFTFAQSPFVVVIIEWLLRRFIQPRHL